MKHVQAKQPGEADRLIGQRVRWRRRELKLSQDVVAGKLGITFQQVQKYENGVSRISAGRLYEIARILKVDIAYFFAGFDDHFRARSATKPGTSKASFPKLNADAHSLAAAYDKIGNPAVRRSLLNLIRSLSQKLESRSLDQKVD